MKNMHDEETTLIPFELFRAIFFTRQLPFQNVHSDFWERI